MWFPASTVRIRSAIWLPVNLAASEPGSHRDLMAARDVSTKQRGAPKTASAPSRAANCGRSSRVLPKFSQRLQKVHDGGVVEVASGRPASAGVGSGIVVCDSDEAEDRALAGEDSILSRRTTSLDDVHAMAVVRAVRSPRSAEPTSHAAVVSRELQVACVVGCGIDTVTQLEGLRVTVDATNGKVHRMELFRFRGTVVGRVWSQAITEPDPV
jgi:phosphohistidine swiveling domain-containing protein